MRIARFRLAREVRVSAAESNIPNEAGSVKILAQAGKEGDYCVLLFPLNSFAQLDLPDPVVVAFGFGGKRDSNGFVICLSVGRRTVGLNIISIPVRHCTAELRRSTHTRIFPNSCGSIFSQRRAYTQSIADPGGETQQR